jgi:CRP/FNR family cyclic AMP-dependent transcriptional regulator
MADKNVDASILLPVLKQIPLFSNLDESLHKEIIQHIVLMYYPANYTIFKENDEGDALYIIKKGTIQIYHEPKEEGDLPKNIAEINKGGFFGEMALVSDQPRNASAKTMVESEVFILSKDDFKKLLDSNPTLAAQISAAVVDRTNENLQNQ